MRNPEFSPSPEFPKGGFSWEAHAELRESFPFSEPRGEAADACAIILHNLAGIEVSHEQLHGRAFRFERGPDMAIRVPPIGKKWESVVVSSDQIPADQRERYGIGKNPVDPDLVAPYNVKTYPILHSDSERQEIPVQQVKVSLGGEFSPKDVPEFLSELAESCGNPVAEHVRSIGSMYYAWAEALRDLPRQEGSLGDQIGDAIENFQACGASLQGDPSGEKVSEEDRDAIQRQVAAIETDGQSALRSVLRQAMRNTFWEGIMAKSEAEFAYRSGLLKPILEEHFNTAETFKRSAAWFPKGAEHLDWGSLKEVKKRYDGEKAEWKALKQKLQRLQREAPTEGSEDIAAVEAACREAAERFSETQMYVAKAINAVVFSTDFFRYRYVSDNLEDLATSRYGNCYTRQRLIHIIWKEVFGETLLHASKGTSTHQFPILRRADGVLVSLDFAVEPLESGLVADPKKVQHSVAYEGVQMLNGSMHGKPTALVIGENAEMTEFSQYVWKALAMMKEADALEKQGQAGSSSGEPDESGIRSLRERAKTLYEAGLEICPNHPKYLNDYALIFQGLGEKDAAERQFLRALQIDPHEVQWVENYASLLKKDGRAAEAVSRFAESAAAHPNDAAWQRRYADFLEQSAQEAGKDSGAGDLWSAADKVREDIIARFPKEKGYESYLYGQSLQKRDAKKLAVKAEKIYLEGMGGDPSHPEHKGCWLQYMWIQSRKDGSSAEDLFRKMMDGNPEDGYYKNACAMFLRYFKAKEAEEAEGKKAAFQEAIGLFQDLYEKAPLDPALPDNIAGCYQGMASLEEVSSMEDKRSVLENALAYSLAALKITLEVPDTASAINVAETRKNIQTMRKKLEELRPQPKAKGTHGPIAHTFDFEELAFSLGEEGSLDVPAGFGPAMAAGYGSAFKDYESIAVDEG